MLAEKLLAFAEDERAIRFVNREREREKESGGGDVGSLWLLCGRRLWTSSSRSMRKTRARQETYRKRREPS